MASKISDIDLYRVKLKAINNLYFFAKKILGNKLLDENVHKSMCYDLQSTTGDMLVLEPRDHFKTTVCTVAYSLWMLVKNPNIRILISHKTLKQAKAIIGEIKQHIETNEQFRYFFGNLKNETHWRDDSLVISSRKEIRKEASIDAGSVDHEKTSAHYDLILNDDLVGLRDMFSVTERENVLRYYKSLTYLRDRQSFIRILDVGTRWHTYDLFDYILNKRQPPNIRVKSAINADGTPYFKARYSIEELLRMKGEDPILFSAVMENMPSSAEVGLYNADKLLMFDMETVNIKKTYNYAYIDPAFGKKEGNEPCYFVFIIVGEIDDRVYVYDWITNKEQPEKNEMLISERIISSRLRMLGIESNAAQSEFIRNVQRTLKEKKITFGIEPIHNSVNKDRRIQGMHGTVTKKVYFRRDWDEAYPEAMQQLLMYPQHKYKDAPDALAGVLNPILLNKKNSRSLWSM